MCNCIKELENRIKSNIGKVPEYSNLKVTDISLNGVAIMNSTGKEQVSGSVTVYHEPIGKKCKTLINITYKHCPLCGDKYEGV